MGDVGAVADGVAFVEIFGVFPGGDTDAAFLYGEEFAGAGEVGCALEIAAGLEGDFIEFDVFFEEEGGEGADADLVVRAEVVGAVFFTDDLEIGGDGGGFEEFADGHAEGAGDGHGDGECGVDVGTLDFTEHGAADAAGARKGIEGPFALGSKRTETFGEEGGGVDVFLRKFFALRHSSSIVEFHPVNRRA